MNLQVRTRCRVVADLVLIHPDGREEVILQAENEAVVLQTRAAMLMAIGAQTPALPGESAPAPRDSDLKTSAGRHRLGGEAQGHRLRRVP
jgi:hypothetical protein